MDIVTINEYDAQELTRKLRVVGTEFADLLKEAFERGAHVALGYRTFAAYMTAEVPAYIPAKLDRASRNVLIRDLRAAGMSTRDAAKVTGVNQATASRSVKSDANASADHAPQHEPTRIKEEVSPESAAESVKASATVETRSTRAVERLVERMLVMASEHCASSAVSQDTEDLVMRMVDNLAALAYDSDVPKNEAFHAVDAFTVLIPLIR